MASDYNASTASFADACQIIWRALSTSNSHCLVFRDLQGNMDFFLAANGGFDSEFGML